MQIRKSKVVIQAVVVRVSLLLSNVVHLITVLFIIENCLDGIRVR